MVKKIRSNSRNRPFNIPDVLRSAIQHHQKGDLQQAEEIYHQVLRADKNNPDALHLLGVIAHQSGKTEEAIGYYRQALSLKPDLHAALNNFATALKEQGKFDKAIIYYRRALSLKPDWPEALNNLGIALKEEGKFDEAITCYRRALSLKPDWPEAHFNLSIIHLLKGQFKEGWEGYKYRIRKQDIAKYFNPGHLGFTQPYWDGADIGGKTILLYTEQGFGDAIQFIRYIPMAAEKCGKIIVECQEELVPLMRGIGCIDQIVARGERLPDFDFHCPLLNLPMVFNTTLETIPAQIPYITGDIQKISDWREKLQGDSAGIKIGLCWAGRATHANDKNRSISPDMFSRLAREDVIFYSLQKGNTFATPGGMHILDYTEDLNDFSDTAAMIENLDLVISVDSAVVHLAGALGKPVWTLLPFIPDWRWMLDRADSPWYPTMRLYRQPAYADWDNVLRMIKRDLHAIVHS